MSTLRTLPSAAATVLLSGLLFGALITATPAAAQFSESYNFLKAVKDKDAAKAKTALDVPGSTIVNSREGDTGDTALHIVIRRSDTPWLGFLLQGGADANARDRAGNTPLLLATVNNFTEGARILLLVQARVDIKNNSGETPLIKAVQGRNVTIAKMLLDAGADPDITDNAAGYSARDYARQDKRGGQIAKLLADAPRRKAKPVQGPQL